MRIDFAAAVFLALSMVGMSCVDSGPADPDTEPVLGMISGVVVSLSTGRPVESALVETIPPSQSVFTDSLGRFSISGIEILGQARVYTVKVTKAGYDPVELAVTVSPAVAHSPVLVELALESAGPSGPPGGRLPGQRGTALDIRVRLMNVDPQHGQDTLAFEIGVINSGSVLVEDVVVTDSLLGFSYEDDPLGGFDPITPQAIVVNDAMFPFAELDLDPSGLSFVVTLGDVQPTGDFVTAFTLRARYPLPAGIYLNKASIVGSGPNGEIHQEHHAGIVDLRP